MSSKNPFKYLSPSAAIADKAGVSRKNTLFGVLNPGGVAALNASDAYDEGGWSAVGDAAKQGDLTDPGGWFHNVGDVSVPDPGAPPAVSETQSTQAAVKARDRIRRLVYRAQGRSSTIKVGSQTQPFTGQQKALLGS